ncbi:Cell division protein FtsZ [Anaerolineae bacterium]|nr:Cell division protein FtsZ [Anaerolineae bacterium]
MQDSSDFKPKILVIGVGEGGEQVCGSILCRYASRIGRDHFGLASVGVADERHASISALCQGVDWVFVVAVLEEAGCPAAAGAIATLAKNTGAFVTALVSMPSVTEGDSATAQLDGVQAQADSVLVIPDWADTNSDDSSKLTNAFAHAFWSLVGSLMVPDLIHLAWDDIRAVTCGRRLRFGMGLASGEHRAERALAEALASPLLMRDQHPTPRFMLIHASSASDATVGDAGELSTLLRQLYPDANGHIGFSIDPRLGKALRVYVIFIEEGKDDDSLHPARGWEAKGFHEWGKVRMVGDSNGGEENDAIIDG